MLNSRVSKHLCASLPSKWTQEEWPGFVRTRFSEKKTNDLPGYGIGVLNIARSNTFHHSVPQLTAEA